MKTQEQRTPDEKLPKWLLLALRDCAYYSKYRPYTWKPKSMVKLAELGFVEPEQLMYCNQVPYSLTAKGREYLENNRD